MNEALADGGTNTLRNSLWLQIIGPDFIAKAFEYAHEADPDAILRYNDYGLENPAKRTQTHRPDQVAAGAKSPGHGHWLASARQRLDELRDHGSGADGNGNARLAHPHHRTRCEYRGGRAAQHRRRYRRQRCGHSGRLGGRRRPKAGRRVCGCFPRVPQAPRFGEGCHVLGCERRSLVARRGRPLLFDGQNQPKPAFDAVIAEARNAADGNSAIPPASAASDNASASPVAGPFNGNPAACWSSPFPTTRTKSCP